MLRLGQCMQARLVPSRSVLARRQCRLGEDAGEAEIAFHAGEAATIVWREGERPVFIAVDAAEGRALEAMIAGATYGEACDQLVEEAGPQAVEMAGTMLRRWLSEGMVERIA